MYIPLLILSKSAIIIIAISIIIINDNLYSAV